jgi:cysteine desulfurase/selenocysteine lyase
MDINTVRKDTRGCADKIFLNSAGSSLVPAVVTEQMIAYLEQEAQIGGYALANTRAVELKEFYKEAAVLLNCENTQIAFTTSATDAYAKAISSVKFAHGDVVLTTDDDYISNQLSFLSLKERFGVTIIRAANGANGSLDLQAFEKLVIAYQPKLIALTHIPTSSGLVQPAEEVGSICRKYDILYLLDACQSVGQLVVDVQKIGCDFLTATGRKFLRGPRGTGILYVSARVLRSETVPLIFDMQAAKWSGFDSYELVDTAARFEFWEASAAGKLGLTAALKYANTVGMQNIETYNASLMAQFRLRLKEVKGLQLHDRGQQLSNILTFTIENKTIEEICQRLNDHQIYYSLSFKDFALIDFTKKNLERAIRFSPHYFNTIEELEKVVTILSY